MARTRRDHEAARNDVLTALAELGEPSTYDAVMKYVTGTDQWDTRADADLYSRAVQTLVHRGDVIQEWPRPGEWRVWQVLLRLATDADRDAEEDLAEVHRMIGRWEPA